MVICVAGKNDIAVFVLERLLHMKLTNTEIVVTYNKTERGQNGWNKSLKFFAEQNQVREVALEELYDLSDLIFLSMEYDRIIKPSYFKSDRLYNIHFSMLPKYKGMYTSALPILNGEKTSGVSFHKIASGIDTGDVLEQIEFSIDDNDNCRDLYMKHTKNGIDLMDRLLERIILQPETLTFLRQPAENSTYYSRKALDYSHLEIDLNTTAEMIRRQLRAYTFREYQLPQVMEKSIIDSQIIEQLSTEKPGTLIECDEDTMVFATVDYNILLYIDRFDELLRACKEGNLDTVEKLCAVRRYLEEKDEHGWTPLIVATYNNQHEVVNYLINIGADITACNHNGTNVLMYAKEAYLHKGDRRLYDLFVSLGLKPEKQDFLGKSLREYCDQKLYSTLCERK